LLTVISTISWSQVIDEVRWEGIDKSDKEFLETWIESKKGEELSWKTISNDELFLKNLQIFSSVYSSIDSTDGIILTYHITETHAIVPIVGFGKIDDNFYLELGAADFNAFGNTAQIRGKYTLYDRHSFEAYFHNRFINSSKWGVSVNLQKRSTTEPVYIQNSSSIYDFDLYVAEVLPGYNINRFLYLQSGLAFLRENYLYVGLISDGSELNFPESVTANKWLSKTVLTLDKRSFYYQYVEGFSSQLFIEYVWSEIDNSTFLKIFNESKYFTRIHDRGNYASRLRLGLSSNNDNPFPPFVVDSYVNIRGSGNRIARGSTELVLNQEYRHTLWENDWGGIQGVGFIDAGAWRPAGEEFNSLFIESNMLIFTGLGGRFFLKKWYNAFFRADIGVNPLEPESMGLVLGVGQYF